MIEKEVKNKYSTYVSGSQEVSFSEEDRVEKELLMKGGFVDWDRRDFQKFLQALDLFARYDFDNISAHVGTKTREEVEKYAVRFFENMSSLTDADKIAKNIEKAEKGHWFK